MSSEEIIKNILEYINYNEGIEARAYFSRGVPSRNNQIFKDIKKIINKTSVFNNGKLEEVK